MKKYLKFLLFLCALPLCAYGNPSGQTIVNGNVDISRCGNVLQINASDNAIIDWDDFSIDSDEIVFIRLPSSNSRILNRVTSKYISILGGQILSNSHVFLVNPNGIFIGDNGNINCEHVSLSTLDIDNMNFIDGFPLQFAGNSPGAIMHSGEINCTRDIYLIGPYLRNWNVIKSTLGKVELDAGFSVIIENGKDTIIGKTTKISNILNGSTSKIIGDVVTLYADGGQLSGGGITNSGVIYASANHFLNRNITLKTRRADVTHTHILSAEHGTISLSGKIIYLDKDSLIDVSSPSGGGRVSIGKAHEVEDPSIVNPKTVWVVLGAHIAADATDNGSGGVVTLWSQEETNFFGNITARGKGNENNGGFVEISSVNVVNFMGDVDVSSPQGHHGTLLIDAQTVNIDDKMAEGANISTISISDMKTKLKNETNVVIKAENEIDVALPMDIDDESRLILKAPHVIRS